MDKKVLAIICIAAVCVVAIAAFVVTNNHGDDKYTSDDDTGRLKVFGNADNNDYLNNDDVTYLEKIIAGDADPTRFADANQDGKIDEQDVTFVKNILNGTQNRVWVSQIYDKKEQIVDCKYPLEKVAVSGYETITVLKSIGAASKIVALSGASGDSFNKTFYSDVYDLPKCGPDIWKIDPELLSSYPCDAIVTMDSKSYIDNYEVFEKSGIDVIRIEAANALTSLSGIVTIGFLMGQVDEANNLMEFFDGITNEITKKTSNVDKKTGLFLTMRYYVEGPSDKSEYTATMVIAGAKSIADMYPEQWGSSARLTFKLGDDWLLNSKFQADYICLSNAFGLGKMSDAEIQAKWDDCSQFMNKMDAYPNGYFILNSTLSPVLRIAFMASVMYPDAMGEDYAYKCVQEYYDRFITNVKDFDAKNDATWVITSDMVETV